jgi:RimJ/RimL family protein N-acetyltransferase
MRLGRDKPVTPTQPHNDRSQRLAERIGMVREGEAEWHANTYVRYVMPLDDVVPIAP